MDDYFSSEIDLVKQMFDLSEIISFQLLHDVQIIRGSDYQYYCYIDGKAFAPSLTPICSLVLGIKMFKSLFSE